MSVINVQAVVFGKTKGGMEGSQKAGCHRCGIEEAQLHIFQGPSEPLRLCLHGRCFESWKSEKSKSQNWIDFCVLDYKPQNWIIVFYQI